jgi:hypothetical protein
MSNAFAVRHNRQEEAATGEPREKVIKINQKKDKIEVRPKDQNKPLGANFPLKLMGQTSQSFFDRKEFGLELVERKPLPPLFSTKIELGKQVKQESPQKESQRPGIIPWKNNGKNFESSSLNRDAEERKQPPKVSKQLVDFEQEVIENLMETQDLFRLGPMNSKMKDAFKPAVAAIIQAAKEFTFRPETTIHALFLLHFCCSGEKKREIPLYVAPCIMIAAKTEEYHPPPIDQVLRFLRISSPLQACRGIEKVSHTQCINYELDLLCERGFRALTPPLMDIGNIFLNRLGKFSQNTRMSLYPFLVMLLAKEDAFTQSLISLAVSSMRLKEIIQEEPENASRMTRNNPLPNISELSEVLLSDKFEYQLNIGSVAQLVVDVLENEQVKDTYPGFAKPLVMRQPAPNFTGFFGRKGG